MPRTGIRFHRYRILGICIFPGISCNNVVCKWCFLKLGLHACSGNSKSFQRHWFWCCCQYSWILRLICILFWWRVIDPLCLLLYSSCSSRSTPGILSTAGLSCHCHALFTVLLPWGWALLLAGSVGFQYPIGRLVMFWCFCHKVTTPVDAHNWSININWLELKALVHKDGNKGPEQ